MVYSVKHFWTGDDEPVEYFIDSEKRPTVAQAVEVLKIDFDPDYQDITIHSLEVVYILSTEGN